MLIGNQFIETSNIVLANYTEDAGRLWITYKDGSTNNFCMRQEQGAYALMQIQEETSIKKKYDALVDILKLTRMS